MGFEGLLMTFLRRGFGFFFFDMHERPGVARELRLGVCRRLSCLGMGFWGEEDGCGGLMARVRKRCFDGFWNSGDGGKDAGWIVK